MTRKGAGVRRLQTGFSVRKAKRDFRAADPRSRSGRRNKLVGVPDQGIIGAVPNVPDENDQPANNKGQDNGILNGGGALIAFQKSRNTAHQTDQHEVSPEKD
jgi:hypothetical protein